MGKIVTILGGCVIAAAGAGYGAYSYHGGCPLSGCSQSAAVSCCAEPAACCAEPSACCPFEAVSADTCPLSASAEKPACSACKASASALVKAEVNCCEDAANCDSGLAAVAGAAAMASRK